MKSTEKSRYDVDCDFVNVRCHSRLCFSSIFNGRYCCVTTFRLCLFSADLCSTLVELCSGQDESCIVDDQGCLQKTLSVENSFRRGTIRTKESVINVMEDLYRRLPRLLKDRTAWSIDPSRAYPTTIRLTVRSVVEGDVRRRPFETHSQQIAFDGRPLVSETLNEKDAAEFLRRFLAPLLKSLVLSSGDINVTKLNIGVTNFQDIPASSAKAQNNRASSAVPHRTSVVVQPTASSVTARNLVNAEEIQRDSEDKRASRSFAAFNDWMLSSSDNKESNVKVKVSKSVSCSKRNAALKLSLNKIDPTVLSELPPEIAAETLKGLHCLEPSTRKRRIDQFFAPK